MDTTEWTIVQPKVKISNRRVFKKLSLEELKIKVLEVLTKYNPYAVYLYGSRARQKNRPDSDADIMVFWKKNCYSTEDLIEIKDELVTHLGIDVDFVNLIFINKFVNNLESIDSCYFDNVLCDAINIFQVEKNDLVYLIENSKKLPKL
jgi:predicted nucleotidyltransferase